MDHLVFDLFSSVVASAEGYTCCLVVVDVASRYRGMCRVIDEDVSTPGVDV